MSDPQATPPYAQGTPPAAPPQAPQQSQTPPPAPQPGAGNPLGKLAFVIALVGFIIGLLTTVAIPFLYRSNGGMAVYELAGLVSGISSLLTVVIGAVALVLGIIALSRPAPHALAGIAVGLAGGGVVGTVFVWISSLSFGLL